MDNTILVQAFLLEEQKGRKVVASMEVLGNVVRGIFGCHNKCRALQTFGGEQFWAKRNFCSQMLIVSCLRNTVY